MKLKFSLFISAILALFVVSSHSASTTNGKLLRFYPITKQHYGDIMALTKKQPVVSEGDIFESHRSLAAWSDKLHDNWNTLLNSFGGISKNSTLKGDKGTSYPICVIKGRRGKQFGYSNEYAGLAPNVLLSSSYYGTAQSSGRQFDEFPYTDEDIEDDVYVENNGEYEDFQKGNFVYVPDIHETYNVHNQESDTPIINCIVVIKRKKQRPRPNPLQPVLQYPHYPYPTAPPALPAPAVYPPQIPHPNAYHQYPEPQYLYRYYPSYGHKSYRSNELSAIDPVALAQYQRMIARYYRHLHALYSADADTALTRNEAYPNHNNYDYNDDDDDNDDAKETSNKKDVEENEKS